MPRHPERCRCGSDLFRPEVYAVSKDNGDGYRYSPVDDGESRVTPVGWECVECGSLQLTQKIPQRHADDPDLDLPDSADRDMVREDR